MSLINQMLKDLDARGREGQPVVSMPPEVRAIGAAPSLLARVPGAWWAVLLLALLLLLLVLWVVTHRNSARGPLLTLPSTPSTPSTPAAAPVSGRPQDQLAVPPPASAHLSKPATTGVPDPADSIVAQPAPGPATAEPNRDALASGPGPDQPSPTSTPPRLPEPLSGTNVGTNAATNVATSVGQNLDQKLRLKLIPSLDLLAKSQRNEKPPASATRPRPEPAAEPTGIDRTGADRTATARVPARPAAPGGPDESSKWGKLSVPLTGAQRAEREYRQGLQAWQAGRQDEALVHLEQALQQDALHSSARQTLATWQIELGQRAAAMRQLQAGLGHDPAQAGLAMMLARLQVDLGDTAGALKTLQHSLPYTLNRADYHAFLAALWQREQKHASAIEHYRIALRLMPDNGVWWMGLGISLQTSGQRQPAREAFLRAAASSALGPELQAFVSEQLAQLP